MSNNVFANMMEVSCKAGGGKTICAFPDVCFTPPQTPATPPGVPIPYPNTGLSSDTTDGSSTVKISGKEVMLKNKSYFTKSSGDEAGSAPKKGVVTSKNTGKVYFNAWSMDVKVEGENVVRHLDITTHNHASMPGNSPPMPHTDTMEPAPVEASSCPVGGSCNVGSPVNPILGAKLLADVEDEDFVLPGPLPLTWQRYYLSTNDDIGWFGRGWTSTLELRLDAVPDPSGAQVESIEYVDPFGRRTPFEALDRGTTQYSPTEKLELTRDGDGRYGLTRPDGVTLRFADRVQGVYRLAAMTDRNGNGVVLDYTNAAAGMVHVTASGGQRLELVFDGGRLGAINEVRGGDGAVGRRPLMRYGFTNRGDLAHVINRANETIRRFEYTSGRLMRRHVYAETFEAFYEYAGEGAEAKVVRHWDNVGRSWTFVYHPDHTAVSDQDGRTVRHHFDAKKRLIGVTDALGQLSRLGLDRQGNVRALIDPAGNVTETVFDQRGRPIEVRTPDGAVSTIEWHADLGVPMAFIDPLGRTTSLHYDALGNVVAQIDPAGAETRYFYDRRGLIVIEINANGGVSRHDYNEQGQLTKYTDCSGYVTQYAYDENGWIVAEINALGEQTRFVYDAAGRLIRETLPDGSAALYENDSVGRLTAYTDGESHRTEFHLAADGLLARHIDALGHTVEYRYDNARRLVELVNENGMAYHFTYDAIDRMTSQTRFDGTQVRFGWNRANHLVETIEEPGSAGEIIFRYTRDPLGRLLVRASATTRAAFEYDLAGQRTLGRTENPPVEVRMAYDEAGRRIEERVTAGTQTMTIRHSFDPLGNRLSTRLPGGGAIATEYYGCGHARNIALDGDPLTDFERDALHREVTRTQGVLMSMRDYDPAGRLERQRAVPRHAVAQATAEIDRQFRYDLAGRLVSALELERTLTYDYDAIERLIRFNEERFAFDPAHNLLTPGASAGAVLSNRVEALGRIRYRYDVHGRVVEKNIVGEATIRLTWNDDHRLVASTVTDARGTRTTHYLYDAFGRRIAKRDEWRTVWFVWDRDHLLQERIGDEESTFVYEPDTLVPLVVAKRDADTATAPRPYYFHCDQVGVPRELTDADGLTVWEGEYHGWGRLRAERVAAGSATTVPLRFQGEYYDDETGLHYNLDRYYDPDAARFISKDRVGLMGGLNEYWYAPNPVLWVDLFGLTGTYIFVGPKGAYIGKGPKERFQASKKQRTGSTCGATSEVHEDFGDDDMGFMVEHLLMVSPQFNAAQAGSGFLNHPNLSSPGKKKYEAADPATRKKARAHRDRMIKKIKSQGSCP